jgi:hypothetical protein
MIPWGCYFLSLALGAILQDFHNTSVKALLTWIQAIAAKVGVR